MSDDDFKGLRKEQVEQWFADHEKLLEAQRALMASQGVHARQIAENEANCTAAIELVKYRCRDEADAMLANLRAEHESDKQRIVSEASRLHAQAVAGLESRFEKEAAKNATETATLAAELAGAKAKLDEAAAMIEALGGTEIGLKLKRHREAVELRKVAEDAKQRLKKLGDVEDMSHLEAKRERKSGK